MSQKSGAVLPNPSDYLVSAFPFTSKTARLLGWAGVSAYVIAACAFLVGPPPRWMGYAAMGLLWLVLVGGLALMVACTVLAIHGRKGINDRVGLFLFGIWAVPYIGVVVVLIHAARRATKVSKPPSS
jgi:hypothetical protein